MSRDKDKLKIMQVVRLAEGGMQKHVLTLLARTDPERFDFVVTAAPELVKGGNVRAELFPVEIGDSLGPSSLRTAMHTAGFARRSGVDLIHSHGYKAAVVGAVASILAGKPFVFTAHNLFPADGDRKSRAALRFCARRARAVISVSNGAVPRLTDAGVSGDKISVIPNGIDLKDYDIVIDRQAVRRSLGVADDEKAVVCVARLTKVKGVHHLIEAVPSILQREPKTRILIAGSGPDEHALEMLAQVSGCGDRISLLGHREDAVKIIAAADVVAAPSIEEGQSIVVLEATALRRPVVASAVGGLTDSVQDGLTGVLVPPGNAASLADGIVKVLRDPSTAERLGEEGRKRVESEYTVEKMIRRTEELYTCAAR